MLETSGESILSPMRNECEIYRSKKNVEANMSDINVKNKSLNFFDYTFSANESEILRFFETCKFGVSAN